MPIQRKAPAENRTPAELSAAKAEQVRRVQDAIAAAPDVSVEKLKDLLAAKADGMGSMDVPQDDGRDRDLYQANEQSIQDRKKLIESINPESVAA